MTFFLKKTFSRIYPRRRSADSVQLESPATPPPSLSSLPSFTEPKLFHTRPPIGDLFSSSYTTPHSTSSSAVTPPDSGIAILKARVADLEAENSELQAKIVSLTLEVQIREEELSKFRSEYYTDLSETIVCRREATRETLDQKLARTQRFISSIVEAGLHDPVPSEAWRAVKAGQSTDDALVNSIKKAASRPGTSWSTIIPPITGPRSPEHYLSAINLTLKTRQELKKATQVSLFWQKTAKTDPAHRNTRTPSPSTRSDLSMQNMPRNEERKTAVDDLLAKLKSDVPISKDQSSVLPKALSRVPTEIISVPTSSSRICLPTFVSVSVDKSVTSTNSTSPDVIQSPSSVTILRRSLATTGQESTRQEFSSTTLTKHFGPVLRSIDPDCDRTLRTVPEATPTMYIPRPSTKSLGKQTTIPPAADDLQTVEGSPAPPGPSHGTSPPLPDSGMLATEKALLSLERICAGFSSGSLGSLGTITGSSTNHLQAVGSVCDVGSYISPIPNLSSSSILSKLVNPTTSARSPIQVSSLPVLKHRQLESSSKTQSPSVKKNYDRGIPAATQDSLDELKPRGLYAQHACVDGSSHAALDDVPGCTNKKPSNVSSVPIPPSTYRSTTSMICSPTRSRSNVLTSVPLSRHAPALAPLASHILKCEMAERSCRLHPRRVFGKPKLDHAKRVSRMSADKENRNSPVKTLRKRKGMIFFERMQPVASAISTKDDQYAPTSGSRSYLRDHNTRTPLAQRTYIEVNSSSISLAALSTPVVKSGRRSLIPVFTPRSPRSPLKKDSLPHNDVSSPSRTPSSALKSTAHPTKRSLPSPLRATKKGILVA